MKMKEDFIKYYFKGNTLSIKKTPKFNMENLKSIKQKIDKEIEKAKTDLEFKNEIERKIKKNG